ncbi:MAG TPA: asparagine synthase-related protein [Vicinamibacterales bacterium]
MLQPLNRVVDLLDPELNVILNMDLEAARAAVRSGSPEAVRAIDGSFALVAQDGITVRIARSLDRPVRYFLAKRAAGPALFVADRIDTLHRALAEEGLADQFHPSYTRMVPAHYVLTLQLVGCPDPDPDYTRFFTPERGTLPADLDEIGRRYIGALASEISRWLAHVDRQSGGRAPIGVCFSGGIDSGAVLLVTEHVMRGMGLSPQRLKAFTLDLGGGDDLRQAHEFVRRLGMEHYLEPIAASPESLDPDEAIRAIEDYKPLDVECAAVSLLLHRGIRERHPDWTYLLDGDGGDENLKDYPIEENPELTIRSVVDNLMLYHEGWGVGRIKHSLTYSGGLSRGYVRGYAPARRYGFVDFSPFTRPSVIEVAEGIPFAALTNYDVPTLYSLKGEVVARGVRALTGREMPIFPKRRFQHGVAPEPVLRERIGAAEREYRQRFLAMYA